MTGSLVPICQVSGCRCATPEGERLQVEKLIVGDTLECIVPHAGRTPANAAAVAVAASSRWEVYSVESMRVFLRPEEGWLTIAVKDPDLHLFFRRLEAL